MKFLTRGDKFVIASVAIFAVIIYLVFFFFISSVRPDTVEIFVDGRLYASYTLSNLKKDKIVEIKSEYGTNTLKISPDGAQMTYATCPDKRDVRDGKITKTGQALICIPNKVMVKLSGGADNKVDRVVY